MPGISAERVPTSRLTVNVLSVPGRTGPTVLFVQPKPPVLWLLAQTRAVLDGYAEAG